MSFEFRPLRDRKAGLNALERAYLGVPPRRTLGQRALDTLARWWVTLRGGRWPS